MPSTLTRRAFASSLFLGMAATTFASPFKRSGGARFSLALAAYSFRDYFIHASHPRDKKVATEDRIDLLQFLDYCAEQGCEGAELTSYYFPSAPDSEFLLKLKRHAFLKHVELSGTAVGNTFTHPSGADRDREVGLVKQWVDRAATLGIPHIRVFAGDRQRHDDATAQRHCIEALEECYAYAGEKGIMLGLENHGGIVAHASQLLAIVTAVQSPWLGINLDTGNFHTDDPYADLEKCAPYAVNVQLKTEIQKRGGSKEPADLPRIMRILRSATYQGYLVLEYEAAEDPYTAIPRILKDLRALL